MLKVQPGDKLSILVSSKSPELAYMFNKPIVGRYSSSTSGANLSTTQVSSYTVDENGNIEFPVLGQLNIAGKTRSEVGRYIKDLLVSKNLLKDATVTVDFLDLYFSVLGEVKEPGRFIIDHDKVTLIDALSRAGDLTIYGKRDNDVHLQQGPAGNTGSGVAEGIPEMEKGKGKGGEEMTKELLNAMLHEQGYEEIEVNESFLKKLQTVIDFYPGIGSLDGDTEKTIVGLAGLLGKGIILDMYGAAKERKDLLERRRQVALKSGEEIRQIDIELERLEEGREE